MFIKKAYIGIFFASLILGFSLRARSDDHFKFHLSSEPRSLDPAQISLGDSVGYLFQNIYQGLYVYHKEKLIPLGAQNCRFQKLKLLCELNPNFKWSDGKVVEASEYVAAFHHLLSFKSKNSILRILKNIKNARKVFAGELQEFELGVKALSAHELQFEFDFEDPEFLFKLTSPLTAPIRSSEFPATTDAPKLLVTGPYKFESWTKNKRILLSENPNYIFFKKNKPKIEVFFVDDDQTALLLYESHTLNFLKTLPTALVPEYKRHSDFRQIPMARFDYIGFSPELRAIPHLTQTLTLALDFEQLRKLFSALGLPGCSSLPDNYMSEVVCQKYDLNKAKALFKELPKAVRERQFHLTFSNYDRDDVLRGMQWMAEQWKLHLNLHIDLVRLESGVFNSKLKDAIPDIFRKSVLMDRPTCLAAIENFGEQGSESFLKLSSPQIESLIAKLGGSSSEPIKKKLCSDALRELFDPFKIIGLGKIHFTMLVSPQFTGWEINELNGLDLSQLEFNPALK